jgi:hypothetical protein
MAGNSISKRDDDALTRMPRWPLGEMRCIDQVARVYAYGLFEDLDHL